MREDLEEIGRKIVIAWIPGHCDIINNAMADKAAKEACEIVTALRGEEKISYSLVLNIIREFTMNHWQRK